MARKISKNLQGNLKNHVSPGGSWKKTDPAVGFAPEFCAECNGRELLSSHGGPFREKTDLDHKKCKKLTLIQKMSSSQSCSHRNSVRNAPIESSTALAGTLFVTISMFMSRGPTPIPKMPLSQSRSHRNSVQNAPIESSIALTAILFVNISLLCNGLRSSASNARVLTF